MEIVQSMVTRS